MSEEKIEFGSESDSFDNEEKQRTYTYQSDRQRAYTMNRKNSSFAVDCAECCRCYIVALEICALQTVLQLCANVQCCVFDASASDTVKLFYSIIFSTQTLSLL